MVMWPTIRSVQARLQTGTPPLLTASITSKEQDMAQDVDELTDDELTLIIGGTEGAPSNPGDHNGLR